MSGKKRHLLKALRGHFGDDTRRIEHAERVLRNAEALLATERGDPDVVIPVSILHDVGIKVAEQRYGSAAGPYQEREGPPIARAILLRHGFPAPVIDEICDIIAHHHSPKEPTTINFRILNDADWLENLEEEIDTRTTEQIERMIERVFLTETGKSSAHARYSARRRGT